MKITIKKIIEIGCIMYMSIYAIFALVSMMVLEKVCILVGMFSYQN